MEKKKDIREHLIEELKKDLIGPREREEEFVDLKLSPEHGELSQ